VQPTAVLEKKIEQFLKQQGFRVLNLGALQKEKATNIYDLHITALDAKRRIVSIVAFSNSPGKMNVGLYGPPPTQHDATFENALLNFTSTDIQCKAKQVTRNDNGAEATEVHDANLRRIEELFRQAEEYRKGDA